MAELGRCHLEETTTTRGETVREFPQTREVGTQTEEGGASGRERTGTSRDQGVQTPSLEVSLAALEAAADRALGDGNTMVPRRERGTIAFPSLSSFRRRISSTREAEVRDKKRSCSSLVIELALPRHGKMTGGFQRD